MVSWPSVNNPIAWRLSAVIQILGVPPQETEISDELGTKLIPGEFVLRSGTPPGKSIPVLEQILRTELKLPIRMAFETVEREVYVAKGKYASKPLPGRAKDSVALFAPKSSRGGYGGSGAYIPRPIVNEVEGAPKQRLAWEFGTEPSPGAAVQTDPAPDQDPDGVLAKVSEQTGLTFEPAKRKVRVLMVTMDEGR